MMNLEPKYIHSYVWLSPGEIFEEAGAYCALFEEDEMPYAIFLCILD